MSGIKFNIGLTTDAFKRGIEQVKQSVDSTASALNSKFARVAGLSVILYAFKKMANNLNEINDQAIRLGVTTDTLQKLDYAAKISGTSIGSLEGAIRRLTKNLYMLQVGGQGADRIKKSFELLGLSAEDLKNTNINDLLPRIGEQLNKIADPKLKQGLIQDLAGRGGGRLIAFFERYKDLASELENRGGIIPESAISAADDLDDSFVSILTTVKAIAAESGIFETVAKNIKAVLEGFTALRNPDKLPEGIKTRTEYKDKSFSDLNWDERVNSLKDNLIKYGLFGPGGIAYGTGKTLFGKTRVAEEVPFSDPLTKQNIDDAKKKRALEKAEQEKMRLALAGLGSDTDKEAEKNRKKQASLDAELQLLDARVKMNDQDYAIWEIIIATNKKIAEAKTEELKAAERRVGFAKLQVVEKKMQEEENSQLQEIESGTTLAKMYNKVLKKQISDKEYDIYNIRAKEAADLADAQKKGSSDDIMNAIKERALAEISNIMLKKETGENVWGKAWMDVDAAAITESLKNKSNKTLEEKSLEYQRETAEAVKNLDRKQTNKSIYG